LFGQPVKIFLGFGSVACFHAGFLLGLLFLAPENGGDVFLRNVGLLSTDDYTAQM
jgi:hypothetical protein